MDSLRELAEVWRERAGDVRRWAAAEGAAVALEGCAAELMAAIEEAEDEALTLTEAAEASGYSTRRLRELIASGDLSNAGRKHAPRIRRGDLPRKPGRSTEDGYDVDSDATDLASRMGVV